MMSSHFLHNEVRPLQISLNILISGKIIKEILGLVASGTLYKVKHSHYRPGCGPEGGWKYSSILP